MSRGEDLSSAIEIRSSLSFASLGKGPMKTWLPRMERSLTLKQADSAAEHTNKRSMKRNVGKVELRISQVLCMYFICIVSYSSIGKLFYSCLFPHFVCCYCCWFLSDPDGRSDSVIKLSSSLLLVVVFLS